MKVGFIQYDVQKNEEENFHIIERMMADIQADLIVLPELSTSGYLFESREELKKAARKVPDSQTVQRMADLSEKYHCALLFGIAEEEDGHFYNTAAVVNRGNYLGRYRKIHLSDFEKNFFERGQENKVFDINGVKIGVQICFDLWFPEISREQVCQGAVLLCALANFGAPATYHLSQTRSVENMTPLILCNRIGHEETEERNGCSKIEADFLGKSSVTNHLGERIETAPAGFEQASACEVPLNIARRNAICKNLNHEILLHHPNAVF